MAQSGRTYDGYPRWPAPAWDAAVDGGFRRFAEPCQGVYGSRVSHDAAESELEGEVRAKTSGGVIRYRVWPARRRPLRLVIAAVIVISGTVAVGFLLRNAFWATIAFLGLSFVSAAFFFPTEVTLDGANLVIRQLGTPRNYDLRHFRRIERAQDMVPRVELLPRARLSPMDTLQGVVIPLPDDPAMCERVLFHVGRWVGKTPTGRFVIDVDLVPEDAIDPED